MQPIVELRDVSFRYGEQPVLEHVALHLHPGQFAALVGPSGAGKTSLLKLILGTLRPSHGSVHIKGRALDGEPAPYVAYVPQLETVDWNFPVTVEQVVWMGRVRRAGVWPWPKAAERRHIHALLDELEISHLARQHIRDLSGGQQQRVFLARALIAEPDLLVLDEPTTGVDMAVAETMLHLLGQLNRRGMTILMTTHDLNAAAAHVPWIVCLNRRVVAQGTPEEVLTPATLRETYGSEMLVLRHEGMMFVQQKPHHHTYHDLIPQPMTDDLPIVLMEQPNADLVGTISV